MSEPTPTPPAPPDNPAEAISPFERIRARWLVLALVIAGAAALGIGALIDPTLRTDAKAPVAMLVVYGAMLLVLIGRGSMAHLSWRKLLGPLPRPRDLPLLGVVIPLGLITAATLVLLFVPLSYFAPDVVQQTILDDSPLDRISSMSQFVLLVMNVAVVAPIVEELLFRGFLLQRFAYKWGTPAGVLASSALFAVGHVEWIGHFVTGVVFALLYLRTRSLWVSMLAHGVYNAMFVVSIGWTFFTHQPPEVQTLAEFRDSLGAGLMALIAGVFLLWFYLDVYWKDTPVGLVLAGDVPYSA